VHAPAGETPTAAAASILRADGLWRRPHLGAEDDGRRGRRATTRAHPPRCGAGGSDGSPATRDVPTRTTDPLGGTSAAGTAVAAHSVDGSHLRAGQRAGEASGGDLWRSAGGPRPPARRERSSGHDGAVPRDGSGGAAPDDAAPALEAGATWSDGTERRQRCRGAAGGPTGSRGARWRHVQARGSAGFGRVGRALDPAGHCGVGRRREVPRQAAQVGEERGFGPARRRPHGPARSAVTRAARTVHRGETRSRGNPSRHSSPRTALGRCDGHRSDARVAQTTRTPRPRARRRGTATCLPQRATGEAGGAERAGERAGTPRRRRTAHRKGSPESNGRSAVGNGSTKQRTPAWSKASRSTGGSLEATRRQRPVATSARLRGRGRLWRARHRRERLRPTTPGRGGTAGAETR
jgi:hypothetical protein